MLCDFVKTLEKSYLLDYKISIHLDYNFNINNVLSINNKQFLTDHCPGYQENEQSELIHPTSHSHSHNMPCTTH